MCPALPRPARPADTRFHSDSAVGCRCKMAATSSRRLRGLRELRLNFKSRAEAIGATICGRGGVAPPCTGHYPAPAGATNSAEAGSASVAAGQVSRGGGAGRGTAWTPRPPGVSTVGAGRGGADRRRYEDRAWLCLVMPCRDLSGPICIKTLSRTVGIECQCSEPRRGQAWAKATPPRPARGDPATQPAEIKDCRGGDKGGRVNKAPRRRGQGAPPRPAQAGGGHGTLGTPWRGV